MELTEGQVVTIRHYSMINVFDSIVDKIEGDRIVVKLPEGVPEGNFP